MNLPMAMAYPSGGAWGWLGRGRDVGTVGVPTVREDVTLEGAAAGEVGSVVGPVGPAQTLDQRIVDPDDG